MAKDRHLRRGLGRPRHRGLLRGPRPRRRAPRRRARRRSRRSGAGRSRSTRTRCRRSSSGTAIASRSRWTWPTSPSCDFLFVVRRHAADPLGRRRPLARLDGDRGAAAARGPAGARDEDDGAGGDRRQGASRPRHARPLARRLRLEPGVPRRGQRRARLHEPRPDRRRRLRARGRRGRRRAVRVARGAGRAQRRQLGRDDQARRERVPDDAHLVHQRDRERVRGDGRRRRPGRRGYRARPPARPALPARRHRLRRLVLPQGLARR